MALARSILSGVFALVLAAAALPLGTGCAKKATLPLRLRLVESGHLPRRQHPSPKHG
ncbi:MAG: hypothetical protein P8181_17005 [bacterium]